MTEVISVRFKSHGKLYYFAPGDIQITDGSPVVVETAKGLELGECAYGNHWVEDTRIVPPLRPVIRLATEDDLRVAKLNKAREKEAFEICQEKIKKHGLDMKLVDVECNFEGSKILFFFASEGRVDFRELVKDLASVFRTRIELRQIGVRDEAKMLGGLGICGRPFCCNQFLDDFQPVSTKMAKTQSMSLNPAKISGSCGRLMCCLRYEQDAYEELVKNVPKNGAFVETPAGYGNVTQINLLRQKIKVKLDGTGEQVIKTFDADEVAAVPGGRPKPGEPLPSVLKLKPKPEAEPEPEEDPWAAPNLFADDFTAQTPADADADIKSPTADELPKKQPRRRNRGRGNQKSKPKAKPAGESALQAPIQTVHKNTAPSGSKTQHRSGGSSKNTSRGSAPAAAAADSAAKPASKNTGKSGSKNHRRYYHKPKTGGQQKKSGE